MARLKQRKGELLSFVNAPHCIGSFTKSNCYSQRTFLSGWIMAEKFEEGEVIIAKEKKQQEAALQEHVVENDSASVVTSGPKSCKMDSSMPSDGVEWFGIDIGGTLTKGVYFECQSQTEGHKEEGVKVLQDFLKSNLTYGSSGNRDAHLEMHNQRLGSWVGTIHCIKFSTERMEGFMTMVTENGLDDFSKVVGATGGGSYKFDEDFKKKLGIRLRKHDELMCLTRGIQYACEHCPSECFYWHSPSPSGFGATKRLLNFNHHMYPYIITNIGSGVSILLVKAENDIQRVGGTSVGGGTFQGLCALLTGTDSFDEAIELAEKGDATKVDKLVRDIYGGSYDKFGLGGEIVASSFGNMIHPEKRANVKPEDLAKAALVTVTNTVSAMAMMCASAAGVDKVIFAGNYLRRNQMSMQMLAYAMEYWTGGRGRALFMEHEGYFCALGALLLCLDDREA